MNSTRSVLFAAFALSVHACTPPSSGDAGNSGDAGGNDASTDATSSVMHIDGSGTFHGQPLEVHCHLGDNSLTFMHQWNPPSVVNLLCRTVDRVDLNIALTYAQGSGFATTGFWISDDIADIRDSSATDLGLTYSVVVTSWDASTTAIEGHFMATWNKYHSTTGATNGQFLMDSGGSITGTFGGVLNSM